MTFQSYMSTTCDQKINFENESMHEFIYSTWPSLQPFLTPMSMTNKQRRRQWELNPAGHCSDSLHLLSLPAMLVLDVVVVVVDDIDSASAELPGSRDELDWKKEAGAD